MDHVKSGDFRLAFVGMSNCGKSYRSKILRDQNDFMWYEVDAAIQKDLWFDDMQDISDWMKQPYNEWFSVRQEQYLRSEARCTKLDGLDTWWRNLSFDTTGSVVYLDESTLDWLHNKCLVVNIDVGEEDIARMVRKYFEEPKPVVWGDSFYTLKDESNDDALLRCFPLLLHDRIEKYRDFSHITIPFTELKDKTWDETLEVIASYLPQ